MKLLARLMSHGFAVVLVVLLAIGFVYRGELFPEWELPDFLVFDSEKDTVEDQLTEKIEPAPVQDDWMASGTATPGQDASEVQDDSTGTGKASGELPAVEEVTEPDAGAIAETAPAVEDTVAGAEPAAMETGEEPLADVVQESVEPATVTTGSVDTAVAVTETPDRIDAETGTLPGTVATGDAGAVDDAEPAAPTVAKMDDGAQDVTDVAIEPVAGETGAADPGSASEPAPPGVQPFAATGTPAQPDSGVQDPASRSSADATVSFYQLLASAREAYWLRDYQAAEDYYRQMILNDPDNPDGYGELANMYFSQGNWEAAASAYYEAGSRLVKSGLLAPARELVDVIRGLNGPQADALEREIQTAQTDSQ